MRRSESSNWRSKAQQVGWQLAVVALVTARAIAQARETQPVERRIVISVIDRKLAVVENGSVVKVYPVAVGADVSPSPNGTFKVVTRVTNPTYYHAGKAIPAGKQNPLGSRWMGLDRKSYGIHGTNQPKSIGKAASHGCIRMARADVEELFDRVRVGDVVEIHAERDEVIAALFAPQSDTRTVAAVVAPASSGDMN
jgi:lipoprotein-anchoring transpeptidase ErfK/SrfK